MQVTPEHSGDVECLQGVRWHLQDVRLLSCMGASARRSVRRHVSLYCSCVGTPTERVPSGDAVLEATDVLVGSRTEGVRKAYYVTQEWS